MTFQTINTSDQDLQIIQSNISKVIQPLENGPMVNGVLLKNISLTTAVDNLIQHGLGRTPVIFFIGNLNANAVVWSPVSTSLNGASANTSVINLKCSANCIVSIWIN